MRGTIIHLPLRHTFSWGGAYGSTRSNCIIKWAEFTVIFVWEKLTYDLHEDVNPNNDCILIVLPTYEVHVQWPTGLSYTYYNQRPPGLGLIVLAFMDNFRIFFFKKSSKSASTNLHSAFCIKGRCEDRYVQI
jgi:hypothetical protein